FESPFTDKTRQNRLAFRTFRLVNLRKEEFRAPFSNIRLITEDGHSCPSVSPCFIYGQECPCSVVGRSRRSCHALSTGRNAHAPLSDIRLITEDGHSCPSVSPCFIYGQECPCSYDYET